MRKMTIAALFAAATIATAAAGAPSVSAFADRDDLKPSEEYWLNISNSFTRILDAEAQQVKMKSITTCGELSVMDKNGAQLKLLVDPTSGDIVGRL